jgi:hypothetical protein
MKGVFLLMLFVLSYQLAQAKDGMVSIGKFVISTLALGTYAPWQEPKDQINWFGGELIKINKSSFQYHEFSDDLSHPLPDYSGSVSIFKEHIYLNNTNVPDPYRIAGTADGRPVLLTLDGYQQWKETGKVFELNILYREKATKQKTHSQ